MWQSVVAAVLIALAPSPAWSSGGNVPRLPCNGLSPLPTYAQLGSLPNLQVTHSDALNANWVPPACTGWKTSGFKLLISLAAQFRFEGTSDELLARFAAVSSARGIRYWSVGDKDWETLVTDAAALAGPDTNLRRADFSVSELGSGKVLYFSQQDNRSSEPVIYGFNVLERSPTRLVIAVENYTPVNMWLMTLFPAHELQSLYILDNQGSGNWGVFSVIRAGAGASYLSMGHDASYVSRAIAYYRHFAAIQTDMNPPVIWSAPEEQASRLEASKSSQ